VRGGPGTVGLLLALTVAAAWWAAHPFSNLPDVLPQQGPAAASAGAATSVAFIVLLAGAAALLVWAARRDLDRAAHAVVRVAIAFGLLLLLVGLVLAAPGPAWLAWTAALLLAAAAAWALRRPGPPAWLASALAAGGYAGMLGAVAGVVALSMLVVAVAVYDAWAVRRASMGRAANASDQLALPLTVGDASAGLSLGVGDLAVPAALVAAAAGFGVVHGVAAAVGLALGFASVVAASRRRDVAGIPFLGGGALLGLAVALAAA
jgi:presenilin-like A22 family membrane protease